MTVHDAGEGLEVGGFREWLPLPLDGSADTFADDIVQHFADDPAGPRTVRAMATELARLGQDLASRSSDEALVVGAWSLLPPGGDRLDLRGLVTLVCHRVPEDASPGDVVDLLTDQTSLYQPPEVDELETASGPAHLVRIRSHHEHDGTVDVSEVVSCFWLPTDLPGIVVVMSSLPMPDLVAAADLADALRPLAESVKGL